jgi:serine/threonine protein kinase
LAATANEAPVPLAPGVLSPVLSRDRGAVERFVREARAASNLQHPNICVIHDIGAHEGGQFRAPPRSCPRST